jgi:hypothetical protein
MGSEVVAEMPSGQDQCTREGGILRIGIDHHPEDLTTVVQNCGSSGRFRQAASQTELSRIGPHPGGACDARPQ